MELPFGDGTVAIDLSSHAVTVAEPPGGEPVSVREAGAQALANPHGPALGDCVEPDDEVAIVVTDITRKVPDDVLLDLLLEELEEIGVDREQVTVVVGLGLHRPMTEAELETMLGPHADLAVNHDPTAVVEVGTVDGVPVEIGEPVAAADSVLATGVVEPHQYAGFSGGAKTVVIGAGSESMIRYTHGPELLGREAVRLGRLEGNPFREAIDRAGDCVGIDFVLNLTHGPPGVLGASAGESRAVVAELSAVAKAALAAPVAGRYDAVICGVGAPKDANLYQTSRAATYVALGDYNPLRGDGRLVVPARLEEGAGGGAGEQRFFDRLSGATDAESLFEEMAQGYEPGAQRAFVLARVLRDHDVWITNSESPEVVEACLMDAADRVEAALEPESDVLVVPNAMTTLLEAAVEK